MKKINILFVIVIFSVLSSFGRSAYVCSDSIKARWFEITEIIDHGVMSEIFATPIFPNGDHAVNAQIIVERTSTASLDSLCGWIKLQPGDLCKLDIYFPYSRPDENGFFVEGMHGLIKQVYEGIDYERREGYLFFHTKDIVNNMVFPIIIINVNDASDVKTEERRYHENTINDD